MFSYIEFPRALGRSGALVTRMAPFSIRSDEVLTLETSAFRISVRWPIYIINSFDQQIFIYRP